MALVESILAGDRLALSRILTQVENNTPEGRQALNQLFPHTGRAHLVGVTGAPGTGKSSLVNRLAYYYRHPPQGEASRRIAIIAIDPSSPFTGGAILGDRVRMRDLAGDAGVFIRSMASRGSLGGLASATASVAEIFDAAGYEIVLIETVGAGQGEVDIARLAHTTLVIEAPGLGDDIQAIKAGILEIADLLVVNKADRPGVENTERALRNMLELAHPPQRLYRRNNTPAAASPADSTWVPPILRTVATEGIGISEVVEKIAHHQAYLRQSGEWQEREKNRLQSELDLLLREALLTRWRKGMAEEQYQTVVDQLISRRISPYQAADHLIDSS